MWHSPTIGYFVFVFINLANSAEYWNHFSTWINLYPNTTISVSNYLLFPVSSSLLCEVIQSNYEFHIFVVLLL